VKAKKLKVGDTVKVSANYGLVRVPDFIGTVTYVDPKSPYVTVDGYQYRRYEVEKLVQEVVK
jgi:hypothetical protein